MPDLDVVELRVAFRDELTSQGVLARRRMSRSPWNLVAEFPGALAGNKYSGGVEGLLFGRAFVVDGGDEDGEVLVADDLAELLFGFE
ncbi:MAG: hypothetical protein FJW96_05750, partial [Actinobacteria bacterium]|nr:hypothetical protein [Actinomycetota bacterium]